MRNPGFRLTFILPRALGLVPQGRHHPCLVGVVSLNVEPCGLVTIVGLSKERLFDQLKAWLRIHARGPLWIEPFPVQLHIPDEVCRGGPDTWYVTVGAEVSFAPCRLPPYVPAALAETA